ncbi:MAG: hypothetical protein PV345_01790 [Wolbachia sp.]|nr:hypothetical protein [Wolbachia sp.]
MVKELFTDSKIENHDDNNSNQSDSSLRQERVTEEIETQINKIRGVEKVFDELNKKALFKQQIYERVNDEAHNKFADLLSEIKLHAKDNETSISEEILETFYSWIESLLSLLKIDLDPKLFRLWKKKQDKSWLFSLINSLFEKLFKRSPDWLNRLNKEIEELNEKLESSSLSIDEMLKVLERLEALQDLKLQLRLGLGCLIIGCVSQLLGFNLGIIRSQEIAREIREEASKDLPKDPETKSEKVEIKKDENNNKELQLGKGDKNIEKASKSQEIENIKVKIKEAFSHIKSEPDIFKDLPLALEEVSKAVRILAKSEQPKRAEPASKQEPQKKKKSVMRQEKKENKILDFSKKMERVNSKNNNVNEKRCQ